MLSLERCASILNCSTKYSMAEIGEIRDLLYELGEIDYRFFMNASAHDDDRPLHRASKEA